MKKSEAIKVFKSGSKLADSMGVTRQFISKLPEELPQKYADWIRGAAFRLGKLDELPLGASEAAYFQRKSS